ncbi:YihY/virulence factor BrkB family protein [Chloroflexota bacterium]
MTQATSIRSFLQELYHIWISERPGVLAAALAYYAIFSFVPITYLAFAIAGIFIDELAAADRLFSRLSNVLGEDMVIYLQEGVSSLAENTAGGSTLTSLISFGVLFFAASLMFFQLQYALNTVWNVPPPKRAETLSYMKNRLLAFIMVIGLGILLVVATLVNLVATTLSSFLPMGSSLPVITLLSFLALATISFALIFKIMPEAEVAWRDVWVGALVTAVLLMIGGLLIGFYLTSNKASSAFEAAGAIALFLIAFYFFAQIFLFGALFTRVYATMYGSKITYSESLQSETEENEQAQVEHTVDNNHQET